MCVCMCVHINIYIYTYICTLFYSSVYLFAAPSAVSLDFRTNTGVSVNKYFPQKQNDKDLRARSIASKCRGTEHFDYYFSCH